jgi:hypothetical protein
MFTRRIAVSACALALAVPAAASARSADDPSLPVAYGGPTTAAQNMPHGDTKDDLQTQGDLGSPDVAGDTKNDVARPSGKAADAIAALTTEQLAAAYGAGRPGHIAVAASPVATPDDGTDGWRIAAVTEGGVLAALLLGGAAAVGLRARPQRRAAGLKA